MTDLSLEHVREHAREFEEAHKEPIQKVIAILIMVVSLLVAATAYFETRAGNREAVAKRVEQQATIASMVTSVAADRNTGEQFATTQMTGELIALSSSTLGPASAYRTDLQAAYADAAKQTVCNTAQLFGGRYRSPPCGFDYWSFYEAQQKSPALATIQALGAAQEARGWAGQRGRYVTVITIFAVALFLIGLTLTVPPTARKPFLWLGSLAAVAALAWGIVILASQVKSPSRQAISAFADGAAALATGEWQTEVHVTPIQTEETFQRAVDSLTQAIRLGEDGALTSIDRGDAYLELDLLGSLGPQGSAEAVADFGHAAHLDPRNYVAWGNLGAARFWLGDYTGALDATEHAIGLHNGDPVFDMNDALFNGVLGRTVEYRQQLARLRNRFEHIPAWLRNLSLALYQTAINDAETFRPKIAAAVQRFDQDLHSIADSIAVAEQIYGRPTAPPSPARFTFAGYHASGTQLELDFKFSGLTPTMKFLDFIYVNGTRLAPYGPLPWSKVGPALSSGNLPLTVNRTLGWAPGTHVIAELFVDGSLRTSEELVIS